MFTVTVSLIEKILVTIKVFIAITCCDFGKKTRRTNDLQYICAEGDGVRLSFYYEPIAFPLQLQRASM